MSHRITAKPSSASATGSPPALASVLTSPKRPPDPGDGRRQVHADAEVHRSLQHEVLDRAEEHDGIPATSLVEHRHSSELRHRLDQESRRNVGLAQRVGVIPRDAHEALGPLSRHQSRDSVEKQERFPVGEHLQDPRLVERQPFRHTRSPPLTAPARHQAASTASSANCSS